SAICLQHRIHRGGIEIAVKISVDHHRRSVVAGSETNDREEREAAVGRRPAEGHAEPALEVIAQRLIAHDPARDAVAEEDDVTADLATVDEVVEGGDAVELVGRHLEEARDLAEMLVG